MSVENIFSTAVLRARKCTGQKWKQKQSQEYLFVTGINFSCWPAVQMNPGTGQFMMQRRKYNYWKDIFELPIRNWYTIRKFCLFLEYNCLNASPIVTREYIGYVCTAVDRCEDVLLIFFFFISSEDGGEVLWIEEKGELGQEWTRKILHIWWADLRIHLRLMLKLGKTKRHSRFLNIYWVANTVIDMCVSTLTFTTTLEISYYYHHFPDD